VYPTFALALQAFEGMAERAWDALSPQRPPRYARLIEITQSGATPLTASALRADERVVNYLKGLNVIDERVASLLKPAPGAAGELAPSQRATVDEILRRLHVSANEASVPLVQLLGADTRSKLAIAREVCASIGRQVYRLPLEALPTGRAEIDNIARLWQRESLLLPVALYIEAEQLDSAAHDLVSSFNALMSRELGLVFVGLRETPTRVATASIDIEVNKPTAAEQYDTWRTVLKTTIADDQIEIIARQLAGQFDLDLADIHDAASRASARAADAPAAAAVWHACRTIAQPRLDVLAQRLEPKATWDDLVLSEESLKLLRQIAAQVRDRYRVYEEWGYARTMTRGLGINALFAGESGTGKTMAAEVIANELDLHLYRIDLSAVVSKYIGETEKNLRTLFDAAEQGGAILFFDEADALFGKRSEVKDSHDRYANIEINYLLQRMEAFSGLAILATNMKSALDPAFMRRLRFIVNFPFPGPEERRQMWQRALPADVPREGVDYERLARFNLSGGNIHSIALNAAFMAAQRGGAVTQSLLLTATRNELRKLEKPLNEAEFR
jgi:ATP-dependent 26S proteasome regulatory subunit